MRRTIPVAAVAAVLAVAACTAGPGPVPSGSGELAGQSLEVAAVWSDEEQSAFERVLDRFEELTGATVSYTSAGDEIPTLLQTRIAGGSPPNIAVLPQPGLVAQLARSGVLVPLGPAAEQVVDEQYSPVWKEFGTVDGVLYGTVFKAANKSTVWYNAETLGPDFVPPESWDAFLQLLRSRSDIGETPLSVGGADGWTLTDWFENVYLQTAGGQSYDRLARHEIPWTDPSVRAALDVLEQAFQPQFLPGGRRSALQTEFTDSVVNVFSDDPRASIVYEGDFVANVIRNSTSAVVGEEARFFPFPQIGAEPAVVTGGDIVVALRDDAATARLVEYLASADAAAVWAPLGGFLSPNRDVPMGDYPDELTRSLAEGLHDAGDNVRFDLSDLTPTAFGGTKGDGFWKAMQDFLADPDDVDRILEALEIKAMTAYEGS
jgi:alpha-glucoside transport system substrate-binding protein